ncbi:protein Shroom2-like isoform X2 [Stigmatopora argus]
MVDVVSTHIMPSENEVLVARCFLTKILRSSMRKNHFKGKNEPSLRPHSWHSQKLTAGDPAPLGKETTPVAVWHQREASRVKESSCQTDQKKQHLQTGQHSYMRQMEGLERPAHPFPQDRVSPTKYTGSSENGTEGKRRTFSCFSSGSNTLLVDSNSLGRKGTSGENIFFKGIQDEGPFTVERPEYLQMLYQKGSGSEEQNSSWLSSRFKPSVGSVWQVPEKRKTKAPPLPSKMMQNDSCATTRAFQYPEASENYPHTHCRSFERLTEWNKSHPGKNTKSRCSITSLSEKDILHPSRTDERNQLHPTKHFSLSSTDVRQFHYANRPALQKVDSDERTFYTAPHTKIQSVGSYYRSLQDLPMNASGRRFVWCSKVSADAADLEEDRYSASVNKKGKHQMAYTEITGHNGFIRNIYLLNPQGSEHSHRLGLHDATERIDGHIGNMKRIFPAHPSSNHKMSPSRLDNPWVPQEDQRLSPLNTPLLHTLAQDRQIQTDIPSMSNLSSRNVCESMAASSGKANRRGDRYATTLRNEVRQKRAQLQKSCSAATLICDDQNDDLSHWNNNEPSNTCCISFSNTYKDNLKEAQARVLQATSFQRRDLEPLGTETAVLKASNGRVKGRRRFPLAKRIHSFSEPDKIDRVGVDREHPDGHCDQMKCDRKPALSKSMMPMSGEPSETKERCTSGDAQNTHLYRETWRPTLSGKKVPLEQQKLGTFAEYQATWNKQKRASEAKIQGRYYSAENILDNENEENAIYIHERSRSSPSADICTLNVPPVWLDCLARQSNDSARTESDHQSSSDAVRHKIAVSSDPCSLSPVLGDQEPDQPPHIKAVLPSNSHLGTESTSLPQEFLSGASTGPTILQPVCSFDPTTMQFILPDSPHLCGMTQSDRKTLDIVSKKEQSTSLPIRTVKLSHSPCQLVPPLSRMDGQPVVNVREDSPLRSENYSELSDAVINVSNSGTKSLGVVAAFPPKGLAISDNIPLGANEMWDPLTMAHCTKKPTKDQQPDSEQFKVKESIPLANLTGEEDAKTQQLVRDIMDKDKSLVEILDQSGRKTTMDLMEGLFSQEEQILDVAQQRRRTSSGSRLPNSSRRDEDDISGAGSLVPSSSYYSTSAPKAELLIKMKDMQEQLQDQDSEDELDVDLVTKKEELISSLAKKLEVLREARQSLQEDVENNEVLGSEVESTVQRFCLPNQLDKFRMFVGDLDKVVSLLLSLSGRLARVENALNCLEEGAPIEEKRTLTEKRKLLLRQHEDAKELKENLDRRERLVSSIMEAHLDPERLDDYQHFVKMKSALIIEQRKLEDRIKLGEEQLKCLLDSLPLEQRFHF